MSSESFLPSLKALFATATAGLTGTLVYHYLKQNTFLRDEDPKKRLDDILHVEVPREAVAYLIGRNGMNIKQIEEKNNTVISFVDQGGPCLIGVVRGSKEGAKSAKAELLKTVEECAQLETSEILVSERIIAQLTACDNARLREIASESKTRIYIDGIQEKPTCLLVRGTFHQIEKVRDSLKTMAAEDNLPKNDKINNTPVKQLLNVTKVNPQIVSDYERLEATSSDGYCEVMVSMVESPSKFFVQKTVLSKQLDCLIEEMTDFYSKKDVSAEFFTSKYDIGALVAALVPDDNCWYRARVVSMETEDEENVDDSIINVELVDFGDILPVKQRYIANLRNDFLNMHFQAIEACLAYSNPIDNGNWTEKATETFEMMTYCIQWKILMARVESSMMRNGKNIVCLKLVDTNTDKDVDIAEEMVQLGLATSTKA